MTSILAMYQRDQKPVERATLDAMLAPSRYRARDGEHVWLDGHVALAHQHFRVTPEEQGEEQPLADSAGRAVISFDGRLDNRDALARALGGYPASDSSAGDAQLVLAAYLRWGERCVEQLLGDFAFVIWDAREAQLYVARDALGARDVVYYLDDALCLAASEVSQLLGHPAIEPALNDRQVLAFLNSRWNDLEETFFTDIHHCPPAHYMVISSEGVRKRRYWDVDPEARLHFSCDEEYAERFLELFKAAVIGRLRAIGNVGISMSGGMDSPSVAAVAAQELAERGRAPLRSYSYVFDELSECDERAFIEPVVAALGLDARYIAGDDKWTLKDFACWPVFQEFPGQDYLVWLSLGILEAAQADGCKILLTGLFGDDLFAGAVYWAADVLREGRMAAMLPTLLSRRSAINWRRDLVNNGLRLLLPEGLRAGYRRVRPHSPAVNHPGLGPRLRSMQQPSDGDQQSPELRKRFSTPGRWQRYWNLVEGSVPMNLALLRQRAIPFGIEYVHPFFDRRLVEYVMAVPADKLGQPLQSKRMLRQAMAGNLPESVRQRTLVTSLTPLYERGVLEREGSVVNRILSDPLISRRGYIEDSWLQKERAAGDGWQGDGYYMWQCISLEMWLNRWWT